MSGAEAAARRLIDRHRLPLQRTGEVRSVIGVTHNLEQDFFDHDFLPNVLGVAHAEDHSFSGRVALQRKLATCEYAGVLVEASVYQGRPSLRTTVYPVADRGRRLHAKLVVIEYEHAVLCSVGSANLTAAGYRHNREVVGVLHTFDDKEVDAGKIIAALEGASRSLRDLAPERAEELCLHLDRIRGRIAEWHESAPKTDPEGAFWSDRNSRLVDELVARWPQDTPVERLCIVSPFWSEDGTESSPLRTLLQRLRERSGLAPGCKVDLFLDADPLQGGGYCVRYPAGFQVEYEDLGDIAVRAHAVDPRVDPNELDVKVELTAARSLHAKLAFCFGGKRGLLYAGSGNFTRNGWGFGASANTEAGWFVEGAPEELKGLIPPTVGAGAEIPSGKQLKPAAPADDEFERWWPDYLVDVTLEPEAIEDALQLRVRWLEGGPPSFEISPLAEQDGEVNLNASGVLLAEGAGPRAGEAVSSLPPEVLRRLLIDREVRVSEPGTERAARFPINVAAGEARLRLPISPGADRPGENALLAYGSARPRSVPFLTSRQHIANASRRSGLASANACSPRSWQRSGQSRPFRRHLAS